MYLKWRDWIEEVYLMYAVIVTGGKQYKVSERDEIYVEKLIYQKQSIRLF